MKTRVRVVDHALVRIDEGCATPPVPEVTPDMTAALAGADAIVVADYGRGVAAAPALRAALEAVAGHVPVVWDPHPKGAEPVPGTTVATPNASEARAATGLGGDGVPFATDAASALRDRWGVGAVAVTLGDRGALVASASGSRFVPAPSATVGDPCGAGDRLAAGVAVALADGADVADAVAAGVSDASAYLAAGGVTALFADAVPSPWRSRESTATPCASSTGCAPTVGPSSRPAGASTSCTPGTRARSPLRGHSATASWSASTRTRPSVR